MKGTHNMTTGAEALAPDPTRLQRIHLLQLAQMTVAFGGVTADPDGDGTNPYMVGGIDEATRLLRRHVGEPGDRDEIADAFGALCEKVAALADLDTDPDGYLNRLGRPSTSAVRDTVRGAILADRDWWLSKLEAMATR
jgi:hypothetical protein